MKSVLFICLGNICRSPTAEGVFRKIVAQANLTHEIDVDSAGTSNWHIGHGPDSRAISSALSRGIDISALKARQVTVQDLVDYDYILAMDNQNLKNLMTIADEASVNNSHIKLLLSYADRYNETEVPDPYYGGDQGFNEVLDMIENASQGLLKTIIDQHD